MKIAITGIRGIPARYGGFETCAEQTATRFAKNHEVTVFCRRRDTTPDIGTFAGIRLVSLRSIDRKQLDTLTHTFNCVLWLLMHGRAIQLVHLYNGANAVFVPILRLFGKVVVVSVDALEWKRAKWGAFGKAFHWLSAWLCTRCASAVVVDSPVVQTHYRERFGIDPIYIPYGGETGNGVDPEVLAKYGLQERKYLLFVGRLVPEKGVEQLIEAYRKVETEMPLVIVGDDRAGSPYVERLKKIADGRVRFLGYVYGDDYETLNALPFVYVTPSKLEGTSPALVASMAAGNCVIVNGIPENVATVGDAGVVFETNDTRDLTRLLQEMIDTPERAAEFRVRAQAHARKTYDWDVVGRQYLDLFGRLLRQRNAESCAHDVSL